ncbi:MAG: hypothetical protein O9327_02070 [Polaromonas sp.]|jgi:hypothetical protein|nr:hypothetical protein [Polaromonas sp.]
MGTDDDQVRGREWIQNHWGRLAPYMREALIKSQVYDESGNRASTESISFDTLAIQVDHLESDLSVLIACNDVDLPPRNKPEGFIRGEALTDSVLSAAKGVAFNRAWRDPMVLRLALRAVAKYQTATALSLAGPELSNAAAMFDFFIRFVLAMLAPAALGYGLAAASSQQIGTTVLSMYVLAGSLLAANSLKTFPRGNEKGSWIQAYNRWGTFSTFDTETSNGTGAMIKLKAMFRDGVNVPTIAFELCDLLSRAEEQAKP